MKRISPLLEHEAESTVLDLAPSPWVLRRCNTTGFVFLENPPGYEALHDELAWQVTYQRECAARATAEPVRYAISTGLKRMRQMFKRHKVADLQSSSVKSVTC